MAMEQSESRQTANNNNQQQHWLNERHAQMLETGMGADVFFLVGKPDEEKELISAHKYMLSAVSEVFQGQFLRFDRATGTREGSEEKPIEVPDICPDDFRAMLKFIYANDFSGVNKLNVMDVYYAGKKYMIDTLVQQSRQWLLDGNNLGVDNVLSVLKHAQFHEDKSLTGHCLTFVDTNTKAVLKSEDFFHLSQPDLCKLFNRNTLKADELFLFQCLNQWANRKCEADGLVKTAANKRRAIASAIFQIRFPLFTHQQFTKFIVPTGLLSKDDMLALYVYYSSNCYNKTETENNTAAIEEVIYCAHGIGNMELRYPNNFPSHPRSTKFHISIVPPAENN